MKSFIFIVTFLLFLFEAHSARLNTQCQQNSRTGAIEGLNLDQKLTIASVTKLFVSHWALSKLGAQYKFSTKVFVTPVAKNVYDVHIRGSGFPYFDKTMLQLLMSELSKIGVININTLSFDEKFVYASQMRTNPMLAHGYDFQSPEEVTADLKKDFTQLNVGLVGLSAKAKTLEMLDILKSLSTKVSNVEFKSQIDYFPATDTKLFEISSSELHRTLKEMNRNSHNYAAELLFAQLSQIENFVDFLTTRIQIKAEDFSIYNGSGYPVVIDNVKLYNSATCRVVVSMLADLRDILVRNSIKFQDIVSVAGKDSSADGPVSSLTQIYGSEKTNGVLVGKTGSVNGLISLAGLVVTKATTTFFHTSMLVEPTFDDRKDGMEKIKTWITQNLIGNEPKSDLDQYSPKSFLPFDGQSKLRALPISQSQSPTLN